MAINTKDVVQYKLYTEFVCPNTYQHVKYEVDPHQILASSQECEFCGGHGYIELRIYHCPSCGKNDHIITIDRW